MPEVTPTEALPPAHDRGSRACVRNPSGDTANASDRSDALIATFAAVVVVDPPSPETSSREVPERLVATRATAAFRRLSCTICSTGTPNAPVLPLPVSAATSTSPPPRISGVASACTAVGRSQPASSAARMSSGHTPSSSNADIARSAP